MTMQIPFDLPNPFTNAKVIADNVNPEDYHRADPAIERGNPRFPMTNSNLREIITNAHRWRMGYEPKDTEATDWGSLMDCLLLTPGEFNKRFALCPETYPHKAMKCPSCGSVTDSQKCAKCKCAREEVTVEKPWSFQSDFCSEWKSAQGSKQIVKAEDYKLAQNAAKLAFGVADAAALLDCSRKQVMVVGEYEDSETQLTIPVKALLDLTPDRDDPRFGKVLADYKTTPFAAEPVWARKVYERGSHVQAAFFMDLYRAATGEDRTDWWHLVQETPPPWETVIWPLSAEFVEMGRVSYQAGLKKYCQCLKSGFWPGYASRSGVINPEPWMLNR